jgi:hypothetical protein
MLGCAKGFGSEISPQILKPYLLLPCLECTTTVSPQTTPQPLARMFGIQWFLSLSTAEQHPKTSQSTELIPYSLEISQG